MSNILLTDTFTVDQLLEDAAISVERYEVEEVQEALRGGFDVYFEFEEMALDAQDVLGVQVPETEIREKPRFKPPFSLIFVGYENVEEDNWTLAFWLVSTLAYSLDYALDVANIPIYVPDRPDGEE